jgi:hypothetical protein
LSIWKAFIPPFTIKKSKKHLKVRRDGQGWADSQIVLSLVLLNLAGGDCVDDIKKLEADDGFCEVLKKAEMHGLKQRVRRALLRRWRKEKTRTVPSPSLIFRYLLKYPYLFLGGGFGERW